MQINGHQFASNRRVGPLASGAVVDPCTHGKRLMRRVSCEQNVNKDVDAIVMMEDKAP